MMYLWAARLTGVLFILIGVLTLFHLSFDLETPVLCIFAIITGAFWILGK